MITTTYERYYVAEFVDKSENGIDTFELLRDKDNIPRHWTRKEDAEAWLDHQHNEVEPFMNDTIVIKKTVSFDAERISSVIDIDSLLTTTDIKV